MKELKRKPRNMKFIYTEMDYHYNSYFLYELDDQLQKFGLEVAVFNNHYGDTKCRVIKKDI